MLRMHCLAVTVDSGRQAILLTCHAHQHWNHPVRLSAASEQQLDHAAGGRRFNVHQAIRGCPSLHLLQPAAHGMAWRGTSLQGACCTATLLLHLHWATAPPATTCPSSATTRCATPGHCLPQCIPHVHLTTSAAHAAASAPQDVPGCSGSPAARCVPAREPSV